ncbi:MAG: hypothetical protein UY83_C0017G0005, partial [Candidatus Adlerbacteria bacterium GW2011_GWA1_54_10]
SLPRAFVFIRMDDRFIQMSLLLTTVKDKDMRKCMIGEHTTTNNTCFYAVY